MNTIDIRKLRLAATQLALLLLLASVRPAAPALAETFSVVVWKGGVVPYAFLHAPGNDPLDCSPGQADLELCDAHKDQVRAMMRQWQSALRIADPTGRMVSHIRFEPCTAGLNCPRSYVEIRYGGPEETNNMCTYFVGDDERVGRNPNGRTQLHFRNIDPAAGVGKVQSDSIVLHELGHCLGLWHEQNRADRERWVVQFPTPVYCSKPRARCEGQYQTIATWTDDLIPRLGNYDYDSIMHYPSLNKYDELRWTDRAGNPFLGSATSRPARVSARDVSRVLQYQARDFDEGAGFFKSLAEIPDDDSRLPNPYLVRATGVRAVGSPAIAHQSAGNYDVFARGNDRCIYWKAFRHFERIVYVNAKPVVLADDSVSGWQSIGCGFASDPSAVSRANDRLDVVAVSERGEVRLARYIDGQWGNWLTLRGGSPAGGIKSSANGVYVGPAIAARAANLLDVFVVRAGDGRLAATTWRNGNWEAWQTLGYDYDVTARPAAVALSASEVRLAINESDENLYEPSVVFGANAPAFVLGPWKGTIEYRSPPALIRQDAWPTGYGVLVTNEHGRIALRGESGSWRDIGGIPQPATGPAAVASGYASTISVMNGEDVTSCVVPFCHPKAEPGQFIQPGGLWIRYFD